MTLVEMLVVLAIIAVMASTAVLSLGAGSGRSGLAEARRLQSRLQFAADRTMVTDEAMALAATADGYRFLAWDEARSAWRPSSAGTLGEIHALPRGMALAGPGSQAVLPLGAYGGGQGFALTLSERNRSWTIVFDGMTAEVQAGAPQPVAGA
jgi:type II secretion system protein H